jgi:filamentous hemagglutinin family protein
MNKNLYRLVFSKKVGSLVAVAETTVSQGKSANGETGAVAAGNAGEGLSSADLDGITPKGRSGHGLAAFSFAVAAAVLGAGSFAPLSSYAQTTPPAAGTLPTGGTITHGSGTIGTPSGNTLIITQTSNVMGANWQSFSIGSGSTVQFNQPSSSSIAVNRVTGNDRSEIYGNLQANGQVFLLNPNGVFFSSSSQVQVSALVASTKSITDAQLSAGDFTLTGSSTASIINQGSLKAVGNGGVGGTGKGYVVLAADQVKNDGTIEANGGKIVLAAGQTIGLSLSNGQLLGREQRPHHCRRRQCVLDGQRA